MTRHSPDIIEYVQEHFPPVDEPEVWQVLDHPDLTTPRVMRSVLFLADGSMARLRHYARVASADVRTVLMDAEYQADANGRPRAVRCMAAPFVRCGGRLVPREHASDASASDGAPSPEWQGRHPTRLVGQRFRLGRVSYVIAPEQPARDSVRCYRLHDRLASLVDLPLLFVLEQLSEHIDMGESS